MRSSALKPAPLLKWKVLKFLWICALQMRLSDFGELENSEGNGSVRCGGVFVCISNGEFVMGCCMSVLTGASSWISVAPQIDKTPSANTGENVEDLENALDTLRTENEALKRELSSYIGVLCVMENFLQCNNITAEELIHPNHKAESSSAALRDSPTQKAFSVRDSIRAAQALTEPPRTAQLRHEAGLLCDILKKVCTTDLSSLTLEETLKIEELLAKRSENKDTKDKTVKVNLSLLG